MRLALLIPCLILAACSSEPEGNIHNLPSIADMTEAPADWSGLDGLVGRTPADSGLFENSPVVVDLTAALGPDFSAYRDAMMRAGPLTRVGPLLVAKAPDAWLVLQPADLAFRAGKKEREGWREWQTAGARVPRPAGLTPAASDPASVELKN
jgi:hypothetical protein